MAKMTGELEKYLSAIRKASYRAGGYPGVPQDLVPDGIADTLKRLNVIEDFVLFNPAQRAGGLSLMHTARRWRNAMANKRTEKPVCRVEQCDRPARCRGMV